MDLLLDGRRVKLREIAPEDKDALQAAVGNLSAQSRYTRFMATVRDLSEPLLEAATHPVPDREFALVAVADGDAGERIVGGARYDSAAGDVSCEFAIALVDAWQGRGPGAAPRDRAHGGRARTVSAKWKASC